jgi:stage V sporulation protein SpoVS
LPVPSPTEVPSEPVETMPGIEPLAPRPVAVAPPELPEVSPPARLFEKESTALAQVLGRYEQAYDRLDAGGAAAVWPSVNSRALARAFARLQTQDLDFGNCTFAVSAYDATARCAGVLRYVQRIGDTTPKTEQHVWTIEFARAGETWRIVRLTAQ